MFPVTGSHFSIECVKVAYLTQPKVDQFLSQYNPHEIL